MKKTPNGRPVDWAGAQKLQSGLLCLGCYPTAFWVCYQKDTGIKCGQLGRVKPWNIPPLLLDDTSEPEFNRPSGRL